MARAFSATRWRSIRAARRPAPAPSQAHDDISYVAHLVSGGDCLGGGRQRAARGGQPAGDRLRAPPARRSPTCTRRWWRADSPRRPSRAIAPRPSAIARSISSGAARCASWSPPTWRRAGCTCPTSIPIVHADLPLNAESLTHRAAAPAAGRKGTAVSSRRWRNAARPSASLLSAHVKPVWTPPPRRGDCGGGARAPGGGGSWRRRRRRARACGRSRRPGPPARGRAAGAGLVSDGSWGGSSLAFQRAKPFSRSRRPGPRPSAGSAGPATADSAAATNDRTRATGPSPTGSVLLRRQFRTCTHTGIALKYSCQRASLVRGARKVRQRPSRRDHK